jgi:vacuolar protein sorting-associated protein 26
MLIFKVGIDECIHIEFEYNSSYYHLKDCVIGKVSFLLMKLKIRNMQLDIIKREIIGSGN